mgnify:CR=1 FL=1
MKGKNVPVISKKDFYGGFIVDEHFIFLNTKKMKLPMWKMMTLCVRYLKKIEYHKYTAIPMLNKNGKYVGTVTEGDLLRYIKEKWFLNIREAEDCSISRVPLDGSTRQWILTVTWRIWWIRP